MNFTCFSSSFFAKLYIVSGFTTFADVSMLVCRVKDGRKVRHIRGPVSGEFMYWMNIGHYQKLRAE